MPNKKTDFNLHEYNQQMAQLLINSIDYQAAHAEITNRSLRVFGREKLILSSSDVQQITEQLRDKAIETLTISNCGLDDSALDYIEALLRANTKIQQVNLSGNSSITLKGLNRISAVLKETHPSESPTGCCVRLSNPMTFFKRTIFNIKVVGEPVNRKNIVLSEFTSNDMELAGRVFEQDEQYLINPEEDNPEGYTSIKL